MSQIAATGNLVLNNWQTQIGLYFNQVTQENFIGYINEVRIWNVSRTQTQIQSYMNQSFPSPQSTPGLLAYYSFDNLLNKQGNATWNGIIGGNASIKTTNPNCALAIDSCETIPAPIATSSCTGYQYALGGSQQDRAYDIVANLNNEFFTVGTTKSFGAAGDDILITKMNIDGNILWSKKFGSNSTESVRKIKASSDGGVLITGQTKSFNNPAGDILCLKIDALGNLVWSRKFGVGSSSGDLGMDIIETTDGYAVSGILNANGGVADAVVIKLDNVGNIVWNKRFDRSDGEDGVGIVQKGDTLIVAVDLQNGTGNYTLTVMKLKLNDGSFITAKKLKPGARGLFNPYLYKNPAQPGYIISGHTVDVTSYANMKHTIITINDNLDVIATRLISINPVTNDFFTGFVSLSDGSFIGCASPQTNANGYVYRINSNNSVAYAKRFTGSSERRLYRLGLIGEKVIAVGGTVEAGQEDFFVTAFNADGTMPAGCNVENITIVVEQPSYTSEAFTYPTITNVVFTGMNAPMTISDVAIIKKDLCPSGFDFGFEQNICTGKTVQFSANLNSGQLFEWDFGNGQMNSSSTNPTVTYNDHGVYLINLKVQKTAGCYDSVMKNIGIYLENDNLLISTKDTTICKGDTILLRTSGNALTSCWQPSPTAKPVNESDTLVAPLVTTTYFYKAQLSGNNLVINGDFSQGNTGFSSEYSVNSFNTAEGQYWINNDPFVWNANLGKCIEHTTGAGKMMIVNGSNIPKIKVWSQTVNLLPNTNYSFSTWIQSLSKVNPANLQFLINGNIVGTAITSGSTVCQWNRFYTTWNSGTATSATIAIVNNNTISAGNDFALDDIYFAPFLLKTDTVKITIAENPKVDLGKDTTICKGASVQLNASVSGASNITWSPANNLTSISINDPVAKPDISMFYIAEVVNGNGCHDKDSIFVRVVEQPKLTSIADTAICEGASVVLQTVATNATSFLWQPAVSLSNANTASPTATPLANTQYILTASNDESCLVRDTINITVQPLPVISISNDTLVCGEAKVQLLASGGIEYSWSPAASLSSFNLPNPVAEPQVSTMYKLEVKGNNGCIVTDSIFLEVLPLPQFTISPPQFICSGETAALTATGGDEYTWMPGAVSSTSGSISTAPSATTNYEVYIRHAVCAIADSLTTTVTVNPLPVVSISKSNDIDCSALQAQLTASGGTSYEWSPAINISNSFIANPVVNPLQTVTYKVRVGSTNNCFAEDSVTVKFLPDGLGNTLHVPTAFTPNNDGLNDVYRVTFSDAVKFEIKIFNRWGEMVFNSTDVRKGWDGNVKGKPQPTGVYIYLIKAEGVCTESVIKKGTFTLIK
jgi:gliding motility-associated-like protein